MDLGRHGVAVTFPTDRLDDAASVRPMVAGTRRHRRGVVDGDAVTGVAVETPVAGAPRGEGLAGVVVPQGRPVLVVATRPAHAPASPPVGVTLARPHDGVPAVGHAVEGPEGRRLETRVTVERTPRATGLGPARPDRLADGGASQTLRPRGGLTSSRPNRPFLHATVASYWCFFPLGRPPEG